MLVITPFFTFDQGHGKAIAKLFFIALLLLVFSLPIGFTIGQIAQVNAIKITIPLINVKFWAGPIYLTWLTLFSLFAVLIYVYLTQSDVKGFVRAYREAQRLRKFGLILVFIFINIPLFILMGFAFIASIFSVGYIGHLIASLFSF